jgi:hypothetical protein
MFARTVIADCALPCPPWSSSDDIEAAVRALAAASKKTGLAASSGVLFAVGNHHSSTYWPAALSMIPQLGPILSDGTEIARVHALNVLIDLLYLSAPEPGFEVIVTPAGVRDLAYLVREEIARLSLVVEELAASDVASPKVTRLARELLGFLAESPPRAF